MTTTEDTPFQLGEWTVRPRENRIERKDETKSLEPKLLDVLVYLASTPGRTHLRQEILDVVWKDTFVTDEVLTNAVFELRRALGDDARSPRYIETIPRKGYRLLAPVKPIVVGPTTANDLKATLGPLPGNPYTDVRPRKRLAALWISSAILIALLAAALWRLSDPGDSPQWPRSVAVLPIEALSHDPSHQAFADALTDTLTAEMATTGGFQVPSRSTVSELSQAGVPATLIASQLEVDSFLESTLSFSDSGRARLSSQLIDRRLDRHLWANLFEDDIRENLEAEGRLARRVITHLLATKTSQDPPDARMAKATTQRPHSEGREWQFRTADEIWSSPSLGPNGLLVGSEDGNLYSLDPTTGAELWRFSAPGPIRDQVAIADSRAYFGADSYVLSIDTKDGYELWRRRFSAVSPITYRNGVLVFGAYDRFLYGVDPHDGSTRWRVATRGENRTAAALTDQYAVVGTDAGEVLVIDLPTGFVESRIDLDSAVAGITRIAQGALVATDRGHLYRIGLDGKEVWRRHLEARLGVAPLIAGGVIFQGTGDGRIVALDAGEGDLLWTFSARDAIGNTPRLHDNQLYVPSLDHTLYALDAVTGVEQWRYTTAAWLVTTPLVESDLVVVAGVDGVVHAVPVGGPTDKTPQDSWPQTGSPRLATSDAASSGPKPLWHVKIDGPNRLAVAETRVYVAAESGLNTYSADTGQLVWRTAVGDGIAATPLVVAGSVLIASRQGTVYSLDRISGEERWRSSLGSATQAQPATDADSIYIGDRSGRLHALDLATGSRRWTATTGHFINGDALVADDLVIVGSCDENVWAFDAKSGDVRWKTHAGECVVTDGTRFNDTSIFGSYGGDLLALDLTTGERRWTFSTRSEEIWYRPLADEETVYFGSGDYHFYALDGTTGRERWRFGTRNRVLTEVALLPGTFGPTPTILFGSHDRSLYALDPSSGEERWHLETTRDVQNLVVRDDRLYFLGDQDFLFAYQLP